MLREVCDECEEREADDRYAVYIERNYYTGEGAGTRCVASDARVELWCEQCIAASFTGPHGPYIGQTILRHSQALRTLAVDGQREPRWFRVTSFVHLLEAAECYGGLRC